MRAMLRGASKLVVFLLALPVSGVGDGNSFVRAIEQMKRSIAPIAYGHRDEKGKLTEIGRITGTGFFVGRDGYFLTAGHVAQVIQGKIRTGEERGVGVLVPYNSWGRGSDTGRYRWFKLDILFVDVQNDLALCKTVNNPFEWEGTKDFVAPVTFESEVPSDGTPVAFTGFPLQSKAPISGQGSIASYQLVTGSNQGGTALVIYAVVWGGASGSPVFLPDGRVVGILTAGGPGGSPHLAMARPANLIKELLEAHKVPY